jgi:hypothetical protein
MTSPRIDDVPFANPQRVIPGRREAASPESISLGRELVMVPGLAASRRPGTTLFVGRCIDAVPIDVLFLIDVIVESIYAGARDRERGELLSSIMRALKCGRIFLSWPIDSIDGRTHR